MSLTRIPSGLLDTANVAINACFAGTIANGTYVICQYAPYRGNVISTIASANVAGCNVGYTINGVSLPNTNVLISNGLVSVANQSTNISFTVGQSIAVVLTNVNSTCANVSVTLYCSRSGPT